MSDYIPESVLVQILKLLPVKTLIRFRGVCKWWKGLIDSPSFVLDHLDVQNPKFLLQSAEAELMVLDPDTPPLIYTLISSIGGVCNVSYSRIMGTLHGIVCLYGYDDCIYLWNPSIRKFSNIPPPDDIHFQWYYEDEDEEGTYSGFWIDPSSKRFKIIIFNLKFSHNNVDDYWGHYWSAQGKWSKLPLAKLCKCRPLEQSPAIILGEVAYWRAFYDLEDSGEGETGMNVVVISFDFKLERFDILEAPSVKYNNSYHPILCSWQGSLSLVYMNPERRCDIYLRQDGLWVNVFNFPLPSLISRVLWVLGDVDENRKILATTVGDELVMLDATYGYDTLKRGLINSDHFFVAQGFVKSLLFPVGIIKMDSVIRYVANANDSVCDIYG